MTSHGRRGRVGQAVRRRWLQWAVGGARADRGFLPGRGLGVPPANRRACGPPRSRSRPAEITAKRRILARHALSPAVGDPELPWDNRNDCQYDGDDWPCADLLDLALPYAEHPDYRNEWLPERMSET